MNDVRTINGQLLQSTNDQRTNDHSTPWLDRSTISKLGANERTSRKQRTLQNA